MNVCLKFEKAQNNGVLLSMLYSEADPVFVSYANDEVVFPPYEMLNKLKNV